MIDDSSTDGTYELLGELAEEIDFMTVTRPPGADPAAGSRDRLARAVEARNFNLVLEGVELDRFTHVMKLDGDIELPDDYLGVLLERFAADPTLGLAGGTLVEPRGDGYRRIAIPADYHVHGALKCYTLECFRAIGGIQERLGWDTIDETYARMRGYRTESFPELTAIHHRPLASADGALRGHARHGECAYIAHHDPLWVALRALKVAGRRPIGLSGAAFGFGYVRAAVQRVERVPDADYRRFAREELRRRMFGRSAPLPSAGAGVPR